QNPLFQVAFALQTTPGKAGGPQASLPLEFEVTATRFDLELHLEEGPRGLEAAVFYATDVFDGDTIERLYGHYRTLLESAAGAPGRRLSELAMLTLEERHRAVFEWNATDTMPPCGPWVHELVTAQAERTPEAPAVSGAGQALTYRELDQRSTRLARHLRGFG